MLDFIIVILFVVGICWLVRFIFLSVFDMGSPQKDDYSYDDSKSTTNNTYIQNNLNINIDKSVTFEEESVTIDS